jgi:hypothetical protein
MRGDGGANAPVKSDVGRKLAGVEIGDGRNASSGIRRFAPNDERKADAPFSVSTKVQNYFWCNCGSARIGGTRSYRQMS